jgi:hypothetical protein
MTVASPKTVSVMMAPPSSVPTSTPSWGHDRCQRAAQSVPVEDTAFGEPFRPCRAHIVLAEHFEECGGESDSMLPHVGVGGTTPRPRKDRVASNTMATGMRER